MRTTGSGTQTRGDSAFVNIYRTFHITGNISGERCRAYVRLGGNFTVCRTPRSKAFLAGSRKPSVETRWKRLEFWCPLWLLSFRAQTCRVAAINIHHDPGCINSLLLTCSMLSANRLCTYHFLGVVPPKHSSVPPPPSLPAALPPLELRLHLNRPINRFSFWFR